MQVLKPAFDRDKNTNVKQSYIQIGISVLPFYAYLFFTFYSKDEKKILIYLRIRTVIEKWGQIGTEDTLLFSPVY